MTHRITNCVRGPHRSRSARIPTCASAIGRSATCCSSRLPGVPCGSTTATSRSARSPSRAPPSTCVPDAACGHAMARRLHRPAGASVARISPPARRPRPVPRSSWKRSRFRLAADLCDRRVPQNPPGELAVAVDPMTSPARCAQQRRGPPLARRRRSGEPAGNPVRGFPSGLRMRPPSGRQAQVIVGRPVGAVVVAAVAAVADVQHRSRTPVTSTVEAAAVPRATTPVSQRSPSPMR